MRNLFITLLIILISQSLTGQNKTKNTLRIVGTPFGHCFYDYSGSVEGGAEYNSKNFFNLGVEYGHTFFDRLELSTGLLFSHNKIEAESNLPPDMPNYITHYKLNYISVPILAKYTFGKYFFVNGGGIFNFRTSKLDDELDYDNDKFGLLLGLGGEYTFNNNIIVSLNPFAQMNNLRSNRDMEFFNFGIKLGIGYRF